MVTIYDDFNASPQMLKYAGYVGILILVSPVIGLIFDILEEKYGIASKWVYLSYLPGIIIYWWGMLRLFKRRKSGYFFLFFGWLANSWCIFPFLNSDYQSLHLSSFIFLTFLGVALIVAMGANGDLRSWLNRPR